MQPVDRPLARTRVPAPRLDHLEPAAAARVRMTLDCADSDALPKVEGAGDVFDLDGTTVQRMHNGLLIEEGCYYGPWMTEIIRSLHGHHEPQEEVVFAAVLDRLVATEAAPTMVEMGAFWSYYTMWFLQGAGDAARAVGIEPDPAYLEIGRRNLALNGLTATLLPGAVGDEPGAPVAFRTESTDEVVEVPQYDLASLMAETGLERVDLLMVDIQGFETVLLRRAVDQLRAGVVRFLIVSTHHHLISGDALTHQRALDLLVDAGAHVIAEHTVQESFSGDGLIAVSFDERDHDLRLDVSHARSRESLFGELEHDLQRAMDEVRDTHLALQGRLAELARLQEVEQSAQARVRELESSTSWRITAPVRRVVSWLRRSEAR